jgi:diguanylate cyclase (GGDEF)-like protein
MAKILIVDEAAGERSAVAALLRKHGHSVREAAAEEEALGMVRSERPDLLIVDILMQGMDDCHFVVRVRADPGLCQPRLLLRSTSTNEAESRALAHAFGAGFVVKPCTPEMLMAVVEARLTEPPPAAGASNAYLRSAGALVQPVVKLVRRVAERNAQLEVARTALDLEIKKRIWAEQELTQANKLLEDQAMRDVVTGLHNRRYLEESLAREESRARRMGQPLGIMMVDVDHFKTFNDTLGHATGDTILRGIGECMASHARGEDITARYGGDEFALVMARATQQIVWQRAEALRQSVRNQRLGHDGQELGPVSLSIGIAVFPDHGDSGHAVLHAADSALIQSKRQGRDRIMVMGEAAIA